MSVHRMIFVGNLIVKLIVSDLVIITLNFWVFCRSTLQISNVSFLRNLVQHNTYSCTFTGFFGDLHHTVTVKNQYFVGIQFNDD